MFNTIQQHFRRLQKKWFLLRDESAHCFCVGGGAGGGGGGGALHAAAQVDDPIDVSIRSLYADLVVSLQDDDGDDVTTPPIVIKMKPFDFVGYKERAPRAVAPWLAAYASKKQRT